MYNIKDICVTKAGIDTIPIRLIIQDVSGDLLQDNITFDVRFSRFGYSLARRSSWVHYATPVRDVAIISVREWTRYLRIINKLIYVHPVHIWFSMELT